MDGDTQVVGIEVKTWTGMRLGNDVEDGDTRNKLLSELI